jgi:hypothetical protein
MQAAMNAAAMNVALNASSCCAGTSRRASFLRKSNLTLLLGFAAASFAAPSGRAQNPMAPQAAPTSSAPASPSTAPTTPSQPPAPAETSPSPTNAAASQPPSANGAAPTFATPPIAIVPLDKSIPGAALSVAGPLQAFNGRAYITGSGTITAGDATAQVTLPYRGTMHVCASSTVKLAAGASAHSGDVAGDASGDVPGLLIALDRGAVEMSFAASNARAQNADTLLTPYFRIMIGGPNAADVSVRMGDDGDTCVDNAGANAPYVVVTSVFEGGLYRVQPGQRVMFEHGSLQKVIDEEKEPCGCPPPAKSGANEFPLAQSEGLAPTSPPAAAANQTAGSGPAATTLVYKSSQPAPAAAIPQTPASPAAIGPATPAAQPSGSEKKPGFFRRIGRFFKRIFGAE